MNGPHKISNQVLWSVCKWGERTKLVQKQRSIHWRSTCSGPTSGFRWSKQGWASQWPVGHSLPPMTGVSSARHGRSTDPRDGSYLATMIPLKVWHFRHGRVKQFVFVAAQPGSRYSDRSLLGVIADVRLLSKCSYIVCTFSSQAIWFASFKWVKNVRF